MNRFRFTTTWPKLAVVSVLLSAGVLAGTIAAWAMLPPASTNLTQTRADGVTALPPGSWTNEAAVRLSVAGLATEN